MDLGKIVNYHIFVRDLQLDWDRDGMMTPILLSADLTVTLPPDFAADRYKFVVCYNDVVTSAKDLAKSGRFETLDGLGDAIADHCQMDTRVETIEVTLTSPANAEAQLGGYEVIRQQSQQHDTVPLKAAIGD